MASSWQKILRYGYYPKIDDGLLPAYTGMAGLQGSSGNAVYGASRYSVCGTSFMCHLHLFTILDTMRRFMDVGVLGVGLDLDTKGSYPPTHITSSDYNVLDMDYYQIQISPSISQQLYPCKVQGYLFRIVHVPFWHYSDGWD
jgi:hypothetical protein